MRDSSAADDVLDRVARRYAGGSRFTRHYVAAKLRTDPVHATVLALAAREPFGRVLDVGCGRGQLGVALLEAGLASEVTGLDWGAAALREAERAAAGLAFRAAYQDLSRPAPLPSADTVLLIDVLYTLDTPAQDALLHDMAQAARGRIVIRTLDPALGLRSRFAIGAERLGRRVWPNSGAHVNARPVPALAAALERHGFDTTVAPCWQGTPFANALLVARRSGVSAARRPG